MQKKARLAIVITHPIRFFVPLMQMLAARGKIELKAFYTYGPELLQKGKYSKGHLERFESGLPVYEGYDHEFIENTSKQKSTFHYNGINNPALTRHLLRWQPDAILVIGWKFKSHLHVIRYFKEKIPVHFRGDSTLIDESSYSILKRAIRFIVLRYVYRFVDKAWYVGTHNRAYYEKFGIKNDRLIFVPQAVDNMRFSRTDELRQKAQMLRLKHNIGLNDIVFLYAGKLKPEKGTLELLKAFINAAIPNTHLIFVGYGIAEKELKIIAADRSDIHFLGSKSQTDMPLMYALADVLVMPSQSDTWGMVLNEAMASGMPVIASDRCGGAIDLIDEGKNGFIFRSKDVIQLSLLMTSICDKDKIQAMSVHSLRKIKQFSYTVAAEAIENLLAES
jgi:glycosyltransferase involved in cell wall biosynthesis